MARNNDNQTCYPQKAVDEMALTMAYVPWQQFSETYEPAKALRQGTIFPELDKPFY